MSYCDYQQVKWGDKDGGYGEQYWDLNHGGAGESAYNNVRFRDCISYFFFLLLLINVIVIAQNNNDIII